MSVVANVLTQNGSWIAYDGRARRGETITSENIEKARMVNDKVCVGFTGTLQTAEKVLCDLHAVENIQALHSDEIVSLIMDFYRPEPGDEAQFLVSGVNNDGNMISYLVKANKQIQVAEPTPDGPTKLVTLSTGKHGLDLSDFFDEETKSAGLTIDAVISAMHKFIYAVADVDPSVNKNVKVIKLLK